MAAPLSWDDRDLGPLRRKGSSRAVIEACSRSSGDAALLPFSGYVHVHLSCGDPSLASSTRQPFDSTNGWTLVVEALHTGRLLRRPTSNSVSMAALLVAATATHAVRTAVNSPARPTTLVNAVTEVIDEPITCTASLGQEPAIVGVAWSSRAEQTADRPKQICRGKVTDYELDFDGKNVTIKVKAEPQFAGCELKLKVTPDKHEDKGGGLILFPYDKLPVKITIEGQFVCKKEGGGTLIVPIDSLSITFQPPDTFIYPLR